MADTTIPLAAAPRDASMPKLRQAWTSPVLHMRSASTSELGVAGNIDAEGLS
jgi:hypothetical protein